MSRKQPLVATCLTCALWVVTGCGSGGGGNGVEELTSEDGSSYEVSHDAGTSQKSDASAEGEQLCGAELERAAIGLTSGMSEASVTSEETDGVVETRVELPWENVDSKPHVYLRLLEGTSVPISDSKSLDSDLWDMAIRGKTVRLNGGISGPGSVRAASVDGADLAGVDANTDVGEFRTDRLRQSCAPAGEARAQLKTAVGHWWKEGSGSSAPKPANRVYVIERVDGDKIKLTVESVAVDGDSATYTLRWAPLTSGDDSCDPEQKAREVLGPIDSVSEGDVSFANGEMTVDASAGGRSEASSHPYVYLDLDTRSRVEVTDAEAFQNKKWDLALKRVVIRANGGDSGDGGVGIVKRPGESFDQVTTVPEAGSFAADDFVDDACNVQTDRIDNPVTAIGTWYEYDVNTHSLSPKDIVYIVETTEQNYFKFRIGSYDDGRYTITFAAMDSSS